MYGQMVTVDLVDKVFKKISKCKRKDLKAFKSESIESVSTNASMRNSWRSSVSSLTSLENVPLPEDCFNYLFDVKSFQPEDLSCMLENPTTIIVKGEHKPRLDRQGVITRQFRIRKKIPEDCDTSRIRTKLMRDGILIVSIPKIEKARQKSISAPGTSATTPTEHELLCSPSKRAKIPAVE